MSRSVVITGIGLFTSVGRGVSEVFDAVTVGKSGLVKPPEDHPAHGSLEVAGIAGDIDATGLVPPTEIRTVDRYVLMALLCADDALADAGIQVGRDVDEWRAACVVSGTGGLAALERQVVTRTTGKGRMSVSPYLLPGMLPNMGAARIAIRHGLRGYSSSIGTACAAGAQSIAEGMRILRADEADVVVCGCSEAPLFPTLGDTFNNARALARGWDVPELASRPFDRRRNGLALAEGAAVFVLERREHAEARGAAAYADLVGWGMTTDAHHPTTPHPEGLGAAECMRRALADAGVEPSDIGYVNAHGTSTKLGDIAESMAIRSVFPASPPVSSNKAVTGHMLGASGAVETAVTALALRTGALPPTHNLDEPDPACDVDHIRAVPRPTSTAFALSNSFGFGGHNVSLVLTHPSTTRKRGAETTAEEGSAP
jgi:3-oxoacyl-[acyl-carrier-protein] synthase II